MIRRLGVFPVFFIGILLGYMLRVVLFTLPVGEYVKDDAPYYSLYDTTLYCLEGRAGDTVISVTQVQGDFHRVSDTSYYSIRGRKDTVIHIRYRQGSLPQYFRKVDTTYTISRSGADTSIYVDYRRRF